MTVTSAERFTIRSFQITPLVFVRIILLILFQVSHWLIWFIITRLSKVISSGVKNYSLRKKFAHNVVRSQYYYHLASAGGVLLQIRKIPTLLQVSLHHISWREHNLYYCPVFNMAFLMHFVGYFDIFLHFISCTVL